MRDEIFFERDTSSRYLQDVKCRMGENLVDSLLRLDKSSNLKQARSIFLQSQDMFTQIGAPSFIKVLAQRLGNL